MPSNSDADGKIIIGSKNTCASSDLARLVRLASSVLRDGIVDDLKRENSALRRRPAVRVYAVHSRNGDGSGRRFERLLAEGQPTRRESPSGEAFWEVEFNKRSALDAREWSADEEEEPSFEVRLGDDGFALQRFQFRRWSFRLDDEQDEQHSEKNLVTIALGGRVPVSSLTLSAELPMCSRSPTRHFEFSAENGGGFPLRWEGIMNRFLGLDRKFSFKSVVLRDSPYLPFILSHLRDTSDPSSRLVANSSSNLADLAPLASAALRDRVVDDLMLENRVLVEEVREIWRCPPAVRVYAVRRRGGPDGGGDDERHRDEILLAEGRPTLGSRFLSYWVVNMDEVSSLDVWEWSNSAAADGEAEGPSFEVRLGDNFTLQAFDFHFRANLHTEKSVLVSSAAIFRDGPILFLDLVVGPFESSEQAARFYSLGRRSPVEVLHNPFLTWETVLQFAQRPGLQIRFGASLWLRNSPDLPFIFPDLDTGDADAGGA